MAARVFVWLTSGGGVWSLGSNWDDVTDGTSPSAIAPGAQDSVSVAGASAAAIATITGPGSAASALLTGNILLSGAFSITSLTSGAEGAGGLLELGSFSSLRSNTLSLLSGSAVVGAGALLDASTGLTLGAAPTASTDPDPASLNVTGGGVANIFALLMNVANDSIYVDPSSILEIGAAGLTGAGTGTEGALTIDPGGQLAGQGNANAYGAIVNGGTITAQGGTLVLGTLSGTGTLQIGADATLALNGFCGAGQSVAFAGTNATLTLNEEAFAPAGMITGLAIGDAIDIAGSQISSTSFVGSASSGTLTLFYAGQVADRLYLAGNYVGDLFLTTGDGDGGTLITLAPQAPGGSIPSPGTANPDIYDWVGPQSGAWKSGSDWLDVTTGQSPTGVGPGVNNIIDVAVGDAAFTVITGPGNAARFNLTGDVGLTGPHSIGTLAIGSAQGANFTAGALDLLAGSVTSAGSASIAAGSISVSGSSTSLDVAGTLTMGGGIAGVGLPVTALGASAGASIQLGGLGFGGGSGDSITTDPTATIEIGTLGGAMTGAVTIDPGITVGGDGEINPLGAIVNNGTLSASGGMLTLGSITGSGTLAMAAGAGLDLWAATSQPILFPTSTAGSATLAFASVRAAPSGVISNFAPGDVIDLQGSSLTNAVLVASGNGMNTIQLVYNAKLVGTLTVAGTFTSDHVVLLPDDDFGTDITLVAAQGGKGGTGQSGTDPLDWTAPVSGAWAAASNWTDLVTGSIATLPPGAQTPVLVAGPTGTAFQSITGTGTSLSLTFTGDTALSGAIGSFNLQVGTQAAGTLAATSGTLVLNGGTLNASQGSIATGALLVTSGGALLSIGGTMALDGQAALLGAQSFGAARLGGLSLAGGVVTVDASASIEVGALGGAAAGALTIDAGASVSGAGSLNLAGTTTNNGLITALGGLGGSVQGEALQLGTLSGSGSLAIGAEAVLALGGPTACPIAFTGAGGALVLSNTAQNLAAPISGFAPGDAIITANTAITAASYTPGLNGLGTLSLLEGTTQVGQLLLAGNFASDVFTIAPDGEGAAINITYTGQPGPPAGTTTPDQYVWASQSSGAWASLANWLDSSTGQSPAAVAPGLFDSVEIAGGTGTVLSVTGPGNAAALSTSGTLALNGTFAIGSLTVGVPAYPAILGIGTGTALAIGTGLVLGGLSIDGGQLSSAGTLTLGQNLEGSTAGLLAATLGAKVSLGGLSLAGAGSAVACDAGSSIEIGGTLGAAAGSILLDPGGVIAGAGALSAALGIVDDGIITAAGGTLALGNISGSGSLLIALGADLLLDGSAGTGLTVDFTSPGTLTLGTLALPGGGSLGPAIENFGPSDSIALPISGATSAQYSLTAPGIGVLSITNGTTILAELTLLGSQNGESFTVTGSAGGGTILTEQAANMGASEGDGGVSDNPTSDTGTYVTNGYNLSQSLESGSYISAVAAADLDDLYSANQPAYEYFSYDGLTPNAGLGVAIGTVGTEVLGSEVEADTNNVLLAGYSALIAEGTEPIALIDNGQGNALLVGNQGNDTLYTQGNNDTLIGGLGANATTFSAQAPSGQGGSVTIIGSGNDLIVTNQGVGSDNATITTSGGHSTVFLGSAHNLVDSYGSDEIIADGAIGEAAYDTVDALAAGGAGDTVFGPTDGTLFFNGGEAPSTVVGTGTTPGAGQLSVVGGSFNNNEVWAGDSSLQYQGGAGSAIIVGGPADATLVVGGSAPITVFGGTGSGDYSSTAPGSIFVVGDGPSSVNATGGDDVWLVGAAPVTVNATANGNGANFYGGNSTGNDVFIAGAGNETLWGGAIDNIFYAGQGNDIFVGGSGENTFNFTLGDAGGTDTIVGFSQANDVIALHGYGTQMPQISIAYGDSFVNLGDGTQIILENVTNLTAANFTFS